MKKIILTLAVVAVAAMSCQKDFVYNDRPKEKDGVELTATRSYDEALKIAEDALSLLEGEDTRSTKKRVIKRTEGQTVMRPVTRGSETTEEPIMYVFNNENDEGFTVVAANRSQQPLIAVTEQGNYTYGEPTGVEPFDLYIDGIATQLMVIPTPIPLPDLPLIPTPGCISDTVYYNHSKVDAMLSTKWGQSGIYGQLCPNGLSGCTNTAAVQIMAYHKHPDFLLTTYRGVHNTDAITIDWDELLLHTEGIGTYNSSLNKYVCNCGCNYEHISIIMREIGYRANTSYNFDDPNTEENELGSGADELAIRNVLFITGFGNPIHVENITFENYRDVIYQNLDNNMPMYVSGFQATGAGHAWVIDGYEHKSYRIDYYRSNPNYNPNIVYNPEPEYVYDFTHEYESNLLHFNWGWNGNCDGWFAYGCFVPKDGQNYDDDNEANSSNYNFNQLINLVYNINPNN